MSEDIEIECAGVTFFGPPVLITLTTRVDMYDLGISLSIDQEQLDMKQVKLAVRPCLTGPFVIPEEYKAVSPAYLLKAATEVSADIRVCIKHCAVLKGENDCVDVKFLCANHIPQYREKKPFYVFNEEKEVNGKFNVEDQSGEAIIKKSGLFILANSKGNSTMTICTVNIVSEPTIKVLSTILAKTSLSNSIVLH